MAFLSPLSRADVIAISSGGSTSSAVTSKIVATANVAAQTANVSPAVTLLTPSGNHYYQVCAQVALTTAATSSSTLPTARVSYTQVDQDAATTATITATSTTNSASAVSQACILIYAKSGVAVQYVTASYASSGATAMEYAARWVVAQMD